jgi:hypothetical protein
MRGSTGCEEVSEMCEGRWEATSVCGELRSASKPLEVEEQLSKQDLTSADAEEVQKKGLSPPVSLHWFVRIKVCFSVNYDSAEWGNSLFEAMG